MVSFEVSSYENDLENIDYDKVVNNFNKNLLEIESNISNIKKLIISSIEEDFDLLIELINQDIEKFNESLKRYKAAGVVNKFKYYIKGFSYSYNNIWNIKIIHDNKLFLSKTVSELDKKAEVLSIEVSFEEKIIGIDLPKIKSVTLIRDETKIELESDKLYELLYKYNLYYQYVKSINEMENTKSLSNLIKETLSNQSIRNIKIENII